MTCTRAQEFLAKGRMEIAEQANATTDRRGEREAIALARECDRLVVARGKKVVMFDMKNDPPAAEVLAKHLLGPTGNLRAPTMLVGNTLLVGFRAEEFAKVLGTITGLAIQPNQPNNRTSMRYPPLTLLPDAATVPVLAWITSELCFD